MKIEVKDYTKIIKGITILDNINITFESGKCYGLKGKNGSGKTMLMRAVSGLITATKGAVIIDGETLGKEISFPRSIGVLIENPAFIANYTGYKNLELLACIQNRIGKEEIRKTMEDVGLEPDDKRKYRKYSLGMKQKLGIASAFMEKPDIIILDEPINAIDEAGVIKVKKMIQEAKNRGAIIITACHDAEELQELSDEIIQIAEGRIVKDGKTDL
ncbi:MAG: ATP-binding cassette domain-containing protein [Lachnospiraceae bacterium]|nr:ATP-binding cassette domain-containing protein [Lachnospiraceae bacterium]